MDNIEEHTAPSAEETLATGTDSLEANRHGLASPSLQDEEGQQQGPAAPRPPILHEFLDYNNYRCVVLNDNLTSALNKKVAKSGRKVESMSMSWDDAVAKVEQLQKTSANALTRKGAANFHKLFSYVILVRMVPGRPDPEAVAVAVACVCGEIALNTSNLSVLSGTHHKPGRCPEITEVRCSLVLHVAHAATCMQL